MFITAYLNDLYSTVFMSYIHCGVKMNLSSSYTAYASLKSNSHKSYCKAYPIHCINQVGLSLSHTALQLSTKNTKADQRGKGEGLNSN